MFARHVTLVANTVTTLTLDRAYQKVEVLKRAGSGEVYYTRDGSTPTVKGDNTYVIPDAVGGESDNENTLTVKLISAGTPEVSVVAR